MPHLTTDDGVKLYYEEVGGGVPLIFVHEFAGDCRSWESLPRLPRRGVPSGVQVRAANGLHGHARALNGPATLVWDALRRDPHNCHLSVFRGPSKVLPTWADLLWLPPLTCRCFSFSIENSVS